MTIDSNHRGIFQRFVANPLARFILGIFPNCNADIITLFSLIIGCSICPLLYYSRFVEDTFSIRIISASLLALSGIFDVLDGTIARLTDTLSHQGAVLDIVSDRMVEAFVVYGLFLVDPPNRASMAIFMLGAILICVTSFLIVSTFQSQEGYESSVEGSDTEGPSGGTDKKSFFYSPGFMERSEAFLFFGFQILIPSYAVLLGHTFSILTLGTGIVRVTEFYFKRNIFSLLFGRNSTKIPKPKSK